MANRFWQSVGTVRRTHPISSTSSRARRGISPDPDQLWNGRKTMRIYFPSPGRVPFIEPTRKEGDPSNATLHLFLLSKWGEQGTHKLNHKNSDFKCQNSPCSPPFSINPPLLTQVYYPKLSIKIVLCRMRLVI